jgi:hypothetical protein
VCNLRQTRQKKDTKSFDRRKVKSREGVGVSLLVNVNDHCIYKRRVVCVVSVFILIELKKFKKTKVCYILFKISSNFHHSNEESWISNNVILNLGNFLIFMLH